MFAALIFIVSGGGEGARCVGDEGAAAAGLLGAAIDKVSELLALIEMNFGGR